jgi:anti-sigma factor RsiW
MDKRNERLHAYLDGELPPAAARALEAELAQEPALAAQLTELRSLYAGLDGLDDELLARDLRPGVLAAIGEAPARRAWPAWLLPAEGALAVTLVVLAASDLGDLQPAIGNINASLQGQFTSLVSGIQSLITQTSQSLRGLGQLDPGHLFSLPSFDLSTLGLIVLAAGLLLLGLVGNSLLLRGHQRT